MLFLILLKIFDHKRTSHKGISKYVNSRCWLKKNYFASLKLTWEDTSHPNHKLPLLGCKECLIVILECLSDGSRGQLTRCQGVSSLYLFHRLLEVHRQGPTIFALQDPAMFQFTGETSVALLFLLLVGSSLLLSGQVSP